MGAVAGKKLDPTMCGMCDFSSKRITTVEEHIFNVHQLTAQQLWDQKNSGPIVCRCGCGKPTKWINWKMGYSSMLKGHNANIVAVYGEEKAKEISDRRIAKLKGRTGWAKGLTSENDERIKNRAKKTSIGRKNAFTEGKISAWNKGLTKDTDLRIEAAASALKEQFANGTRVQWHKGLLSSTDDRVRKKNENLKNAYASGELVAWHAGKTTDDDPRIKKFWLSRDAMKEYAHLRWSNDDIEKMLENNTQTYLVNIDHYKNNRTPGIRIACRTCNWNSVVTLIFAKTDCCPLCAPKGSKPQTEIADMIEGFISSKVGKNIRGLLSGKQEIDIYVATHKLAIELNGLYWHSEITGRQQNYHQNKLDKSQQLGMNLIHIYEDEWYSNRPILESMIKHHLKLSTRVGARKCTIVNVTPEERKKFFEANHLDGDTYATNTIGLKLNDELLMAISFRRPFHKKYVSTIEVARVAAAKNYAIVGGLGKLTKAAKEWAKQEGYSQLLTYVDTRHGSNGSNWEKAGWSKISETPARWWWTDFRERFNRFKYRADKSRNMTEAQVAEEAGVVKIWGCKNLVYNIEF